MGCRERAGVCHRHALIVQKTQLRTWQVATLTMRMHGKRNAANALDILNRQSILMMMMMMMTGTGIGLCHNCGQASV